MTPEQIELFVRESNHIEGIDRAPMAAEIEATRARQVYVPVAAILHHAGVQITLRKPKGAKGVNRTFWLSQNTIDAALIDPTALPSHQDFQSTGIVLGKVFIQTLSFNGKGRSGQFDSPTSMAAIHPFAGDALARPNHALDDFAADRISASFCQIPKHLIRRAWDVSI